VVVRYRNIFGSERGYGNLKWIELKLRKRRKEVSTGNDQNKKKW